MQAYVLIGHNGPDSLVLTDLPTPTPGPDEVLLRVQAISLNPVDAQTAHGQALWSVISAAPPVVDGWDVAGQVMAVGSLVKEFTIGDSVFGMINFPGSGRAYADYVTAPAAQLALRPAAVSTVNAAAAGLAAMTAWQALAKAQIRPGERVLIQAAAGGVGHFAIQLAKIQGAYVIGVASTANGTFIRSLGADEFIDYTQVHFEDVVKPVDFVLESIPGDNQMRSLSVVKPGGRLISLRGVTPELIAQSREKGIDASDFAVSSNGDDQRAIADYLADGRLRPAVSQTFRFDKLADAMRQLESGRTQGKLVVTLEF